MMQRLTTTPRSKQTSLSMWAESPQTKCSQAMHWAQCKYVSSFCADYSIYFVYLLQIQKYDFLWKLVVFFLRPRIPVPLLFLFLQTPHTTCSDGILIGGNSLHSSQQLSKADVSDVPFKKLCPSPCAWWTAAARAATLGKNMSLFSGELWDASCIQHDQSAAALIITPTWHFYFARHWSI